MDEKFSIGELVDVVNQWCVRHKIVPASNQAGERMTDRNVRFYRTVGLVDAPESGGGQGYGEKHKLQVIAVRLLQSQGLPLRRIRELLLGRSLADLRRIEKQGLAEARSAPVLALKMVPGEDWRMTPLNGEFLLVSRTNRALPPELLEQIRDLLQTRQTTGKEGKG
ncbi:MAG: MerR family transcriptional regulator [Pedosphaera sp.]|nr:MerR family transcriptional regulator [Pedosphaera sp.]